MKILMLAPQPFFEPRGTPFSVLGRLKALSALGHEVDLITYHVGQDVKVPGVVIHRTPKIGFIKTVKIGPSMPKIMLDLLVFLRALQLLRRGDYDLLHSHEEASFFGILLAKFFNIRHLYDMHSSLTQQLSNFQYSRFGPLVRIFEWLERRAINNSNAIITICPALADHVTPINEHVLQMMIENVDTGTDPASLSEETVREFRSAFPQLDGKSVILYAGTFETYQGLDLLVASAQQVLRQRDNVLFLLVGGKPEQVGALQDQVKQLGLADHFYFTGNRPPDEIPLFIRLSEVLISPRVSGTNTPLKIYSYLQSGKPIVATDLYTHTQVLNPDVSVLVEPNSDALARGIIHILENPQVAASLGARARQLFETAYGYQTYIQKTDQILQLAAYGSYTPSEPNHSKDSQSRVTSE